MRQIVISDRSRLILEKSVARSMFKLDRQLRDRSWECSIDDELAATLDKIARDPDRAIQTRLGCRMVCRPLLKKGML